MSATFNLQNFIQIYKDAIPKKLINLILAQNEKLEWKSHEWTNYNGVVPSPQPNKEFLRANFNKFEKIFLNQYIDQCVLEYTKKHNFGLHGKSPIVINKYEKGQELMEHIDHKTNYFDGKNKGIPIITLIGSLNNTFTGGELILCKDYQVNLNPGDLVIFPSNFLFPHAVKCIESGTRLSINQWFW